LLTPLLTQEITKQLSLKKLISLSFLSPNHTTNNLWAGAQTTQLSSPSALKHFKNFATTTFTASHNAFNPQHPNNNLVNKIFNTSSLQNFNFFESSQLFFHKMYFLRNQQRASVKNINFLISPNRLFQPTKSLPFKNNFAELTSYLPLQIGTFFSDF
jgi:hypothetical protein